MKEIGEKLKVTREEMGISLDEAAEDLKLRPSQLEAIEEGNMDSFKDVFNLKYFIRDYSKYLGLNYEDMIDDFNEYLFDYTSKLSLHDIKKAHTEYNKEQEENKIKSPYTMEIKNKKIGLKITVFILVLIIISIIAFIYVQKNKKTKSEEEVVLRVL